MANVSLNPLLERIRGAFGDLVFKRFLNRTVIARKPDTTGREPSAAQSSQADGVRPIGVRSGLGTAIRRPRPLYCRNAS